MGDLTRKELAEAVPEAGLFAQKEWLWSPRPYLLDKSEQRYLERLGHILGKFQEACDSIYQRSAAGKLPEWIAELLDVGKPSWLVDHQRLAGRRGERPRVIRPDLLLTQNGFSMTELDAVPGGMGLLAWLSGQYEKGGFQLIGGKKEMIEGFRSLLPNGGDILVSEESGDYRPEMAWLAGELGADWRVRAAEEWQADGRDVYRFFELFDWESVPDVRHMGEKARVTPPLKPHFEEKLWLALFWLPSLKKVWEEEMRGPHLQRLRELIPYGWVVDPSPIPPHAAIPRLNVSSWDEVAGFSQKDRRLVLKISGFSELAWGSRSVVIGHDTAKEEWAASLANAAADFEDQPWLVQEFHEARQVEHPYFDESGEIRMMKGRTRLCPYYFIGDDGETNLGGCLATIVPLDKKKIHGMSEAIMVPCA